MERCLTSIIAQTFSDFEVILIDDGSPDNCPRLCDEWARRDSRISVVHKPNGGLSDARNAGLDKARGEFITFVDSDDFVQADTYAQLMPQAEQCDLLEFPFVCHYGTSRQQLVAPPTATYERAGQYWLQSHAYEHCYAWNKIYRRRLFHDVRFPVGRVFEDVATLPLLLRHAQTIAVTDCGCYFYTDNPNGITHMATGSELKMLLDAHLQVLPRWCDDRYYLHVLNIQLDVCRLTGLPPALPFRMVNPLTGELSTSQRLKAFLQDIIGIKGLCHINKTTSKSRS